MLFTNFWKPTLKDTTIIAADNYDKVKALEDYLDIEYFSGPKYKPHYRKRRVVKKKLGRPRKNI